VALSDRTITPAAELLLATAAMPPDEAAIRQLCAGGFDWQELCGLAEWEKAPAVVWQQVERLTATVSDPGRDLLHQLATFSAMRMLQLEQLLHQTLDALAERGIEAMLLKGAALAHTAYDSFADRPMGDLDLLLRSSDAEPAWSLLQARGWFWPQERWALPSYTGHQHLPPLLWQPGEFRLELHAQLLADDQPFRLTTEAVWHSAQRIQPDGRVVVVPSRLHQLWYVCVHFAWAHQLQWGAWRALRDCGAIVQNGEISWPELVQLARDSLAVSSCYWTLRLARRLARAAVPEHVLAALRPPRSDLILDRLERHYLANLLPSSNGCPSLWLGKRLWEAGMLPGWSGHGRSRPWHSGQRWVEGSPERDAARPASLWARVRRLPLWVGYLGRIGRA
jgi:hypothetical protein